MFVESYKRKDSIHIRKIDLRRQFRFFIDMPIYYVYQTSNIHYEAIYHSMIPSFRAFFYLTIKR
jgi:hypothetical protein